MELKDLEGIPFGVSALDSVFPDLSALDMKAKRLEEKGEIIRLKRGLYVVSPTKSGHRVNDFLVANHLYGPSYVSMETALRFYGLIPEAVYETESVTVKRPKIFTNPLGKFSYFRVPERYYPIGITQKSDGNETFLIATPEKALCDLVALTSNLNMRYIKEIRTWLEEDMRFDMDALRGFDTSIMKLCAAEGKKKTMLTQIIKIIEDERNI